MTRPGPTSTTISSVLEVSGENTHLRTFGGFTGEGTDQFSGSGERNAGMKFRLYSR